MPVIQRPNTDQQRLQALETAKAKADVTPPGSLSFSAATSARLTAFLPLFRAEVLARGVKLSAQVAATTLSDAAMTTLAMFISHFFQVFNLGIHRGVYTADQRAFFSIPTNHEDLPELNTEAQVQLWANRVVTGDAARVTAGGAAMTNPTAAQVNGAFTTFTTTEGDKTGKKDAYDLEQEAVAAMRPEADDIIADIWNESEFTYRKETPSSRRRKCREDGVVYRPRTGEALSPDDFSMTGKVTDSVTGLPIAGVALRVLPIDVIVTTDADGNYFVGVLAAGSYSVEVHKAGYADQSLVGVSITDGHITSLNVVMVAAGVGTVSGTVLIAPGTNQATVSVEGTGISTTTSITGAYTLSNVPEGAQTIRATQTSNPANTQTQSTTVVAGGSVTVNFSF